MTDAEENSDLEIIKKFIYNDNVQDTFCEINNRIKTINFFEISGMGNQEIKHSKVLGWLLGDKQHALDNLFFNEFLKSAIVTTQELSENTFSDSKIDGLKNYIYLIEHKDLDILYEQKNIDILIIDEENEFIFIVENKVFANESKKQLMTYRKSIEEDEKYKNYNSFGIYLTPGGKLPSEKSEDFKENRNFYLSVSYSDIEKIIKQMINNNASIQAETKLIFEHYLDLLIRSNIVNEDELENLCKEIWKNETYSKALEILDNYKPDIDSEIRDYLIEKLKDNPNNRNIQIEESNKRHIRFSDIRLDDINGQKTGKGWSKNINRVILYEFQNGFNDFGLRLKLIIGPGDNDFRKKMFENCHTEPFKIKSKKLADNWNQIKDFQVLEKTCKKEKIFEKIDKFIDNFFEPDNHFDELFEALKKANSIN